MAEDINGTFEAASDLDSNTEISEERELGLRTLEDVENDQPVDHIHPESDILYPTEPNGKVIDPLTGQQVDPSDAFTAPDPKADSTSDDFDEESVATIPSVINIQEAQDDNDFPRKGGLLDFPRERKVPRSKTKNSGGDIRPSSGNRTLAAPWKVNIPDDFSGDVDGSETRQIFIFRSGEVTSIEIVDLLVPVDEAKKQVFGEIYPDANLEDFQEQGGVVIPDNEVPDVQDGRFELNSEYVSVFLNDIGLSSEFTSNLKPGSSIDSAPPEINLSVYQLGHITSGFVTGNFPSYVDDLDGLGIYTLSSEPVTDLENINDNFEF